MRVLVTGGAGFIGREIASRLLTRGDEVRVLDNLDPRVHGRGEPPVPPEAEFVRGDLLSAHALARVLRNGVDAVFHEAAMVGLGRGARDREVYRRVNVLGTERLIRTLASCASRPDRLVLASTMAVYGEGAYLCPRCEQPQTGRREVPDLRARRWDPACPVCRTPLLPTAVREDHPPRPSTLYARTKLLQERRALALGRSLGVPVVALRYHNVYGPWMPQRTSYAGVASFFRSRLEAGLAPLVFEDGAQLRDFVRVEDVARANLLAADADRERVEGQSFNVGSGTPRSILDLARTLTRALRPELTPVVTNDFRPGDARHVFADVSKARTILGFSARIPYAVGVRRFAREPLRAPPARTSA